MRRLHLTKDSPRLTIEKVREEDPEIITCLEYPYILLKEILEYPKYGCINAHYSLLPKYRGRHPIQWAMINGETEVGVTVHYMVEETDAGAILKQYRLYITPNSKYKDVYKEMYALGSYMLDSIIQDPATLQKWKPQDHTQATYAPSRIPKDSCANRIIRGDLKELCCFINAMSDPMPNAYLEDSEGRLYFKGAKWVPFNETDGGC